MSDADKARNLMKVMNQLWLIAAKEALQGDMGKLRCKVALAEGRPRDSVWDDVANAR